METREICDALAITPSHCWVLLHRARARLRALPDLAELAGAGG
jgi:DNA-directed RNA polymerase specialized sigma24 family protein